MLSKDTFRLIKSTYKRFISLVCIVLIGVAFMIGLFVTPDTMRNSVDAYNNDIKLANIQIYSSYGFCDEDIEELKKLSSVSSVYASKQIDLFAKLKDSDSKVMRIREIDSVNNSFTLLSGRLPKKENEILIINGENTAFDIGQKVIVYLDDEDILETLKYDEYTIVGIAKSGEYMSKLQSTSNLKNLNLDLIAYGKNSIFLADYYTSLYIRGKDSSNYNYFSEEYNNYLNKFKSQIEKFASKQQDYFKSTIYEKAIQKIEDGEKELIEQKAKGIKELEDAKRQLDDAKNLIDNGQSQLDSAKQKLIDGQKQIDNGKIEIENGKKTLADSKTQLDNAQIELDNNIASIESAAGMSIGDLVSNINSLYQTYIEADNTQLPDAVVDGLIGPQKAALDALYNTIGNLTNTINDLENQIGSDSALINGLKQQLKNAQNSVVSLENEIDNIVENARQEYVDLIKSQLDNQVKGNTIAGTSVDGVVDAYQKVTAMKNQLDSAQAEINKGKAQYEDGLAKLIANENALPQAQAKIDQGWIDYENGVIEFENAKVKYADGLKDYEIGLNDFNRKINEAEIEIRKAKEDLLDLPNARWTVIGKESSYSMYVYDSSCSQMEAVCFIMPILFYLVAALVCLTTMTRLIDEERGQIGIYAALGYSKLQILSKYIIYVFLACLIGCSVGIVSGVLIFPSVIYNTWRIMYDLPDMIINVPINTAIFCADVFFVLIAFVTTYVVMKSLKETSASLLRPKAPKKTKKVLVERIPFLWNMFSFTGKITARNLFRYKARFFMSVIGVAGCTSLLILGFGLKDSISDVVNIQYKEIFKYQYNVNLENDSNIDEIVTILKKDKTNSVVVPFDAYYSKVYYEDCSDTVQVRTVDPKYADKLYGFIDTDGNDCKFTNKTVAITEKYAQTHNLKIGDFITIESKEGLKAKVKITNIYKMYFQHYLFIAEDVYKNTFDIDIHNTSIGICTTNSIENISNYLKDIKGYSSTTDFTAFIEHFNIMIEALDKVVVVIILTAGSLAFVVLFNLIQVNISERIREIATLKVLGFKEIEVNVYLFKEILLLTLIGGILGMPLGKVELGFVMSEINVEMVMFPVDIKPLSYMYGMIISFVFTVVVLIYTRKELRKVQMVESLKSVE